MPLKDRIDNPDGMHLYGITESNGKLFVAGEVGVLFRSLDKGLTWEALESPYDGSFFSVFGSENE